MQKKIIMVLLLLFVVSSITVFSKVCTAWYYLLNWNTGQAVVVIDYGEGKVDTKEYKSFSLTNFISEMEKEGWKIEYYSMSNNERLPQHGFIFRK